MELSMNSLESGRSEFQKQIMKMKDKKQVLMWREKKRKNIQSAISIKDFILEMGK